LNKTLLFITVLVIATCGLIYELIVGTLASYLLGDSITQFSTVIGGYLFAMGIGSWLSRFIERGVPQRFVEIELGVALLGGACAPLLFLTFALTDVFRVALYGSVLAIGTLVGLEIPLLLRILKDQVKFKDLVSQVLTFDYLGALAASISFPLLFVGYELEDEDFESILAQVRALGEGQRELTGRTQALVDALRAPQADFGGRRLRHALSLRAAAPRPAASRGCRRVSGRRGGPPRSPARRACGRSAAAPW